MVVRRLAVLAHRTATFSLGTRNAHQWWVPIVVRKDIAIMMRSADSIPGIESGIPQQPLVVIPLRHGCMYEDLIHADLIHATVAEWYHYQRLLRNPGFDSQD